MIQKLCPECGNWSGPSPHLSADEVKRFEEICDKYFVSPKDRPPGWKENPWEPASLDIVEIGDLINMVTQLRS